MGQGLSDVRSGIFISPFFRNLKVIPNTYLLDFAVNKCIWSNSLDRRPQWYCTVSPLLQKNVIEWLVQFCYEKLRQDRQSKILKNIWCHEWMEYLFSSFVHFKLEFEKININFLMALYIFYYRIDNKLWAYVQSLRMSINVDDRVNQRETCQILVYFGWINKMDLNDL